MTGKVSLGVLSDDQKLRLMLTNPALAKVVFLNCDVFSLGEIRRVDGDVDDFVRKLQRPNYFQNLRQWLWDYRFWLMFGTSYLYSSSRLANQDKGQMYWLNSTCLDWDSSLDDDLEGFVLSERSLNQIKKLEVDYTFSNGKVKSFRLEQLTPFHDLSNGGGNWYRGHSRIDALAKILLNVDEGLDAKKINLEFAKKFLVSGSYDPEKHLESLVTLDNIERLDIEKEIRSNKSVYPIKSMVEIKRFVEDMAELEFDEAYESDLIKVGSMYNIPKDILDFGRGEGATYENQDRSLSRHISYSEEPKGAELVEGLCRQFDLDPSQYEMSWAHLPAMQRDTKTEASVAEQNARTLQILIASGADANEAAEYLGIDLTFDEQDNREDQAENQNGNEPSYQGGFGEEAEIDGDNSD